LSELQIGHELTYGVVLCALGLFLFGIFFLPLVGFLKKNSMRIIRRLDDDAKFQLKSIDHRILNTPLIALGQARAETRRMASLSLQCLDETLLFLTDFDKRRVSNLKNMEELLDRLQKEIMVFLVALSLKSISEETSREITSLMHLVNYLERIGDQCEHLWRLEVRKLDQKIYFSKMATGEIHELSARTRHFLFYVVDKIGGAGDKKQLQLQSMKMDAEIAALESDLRHNHINRLHTGECAVLPGLIFIDMLYDFKLIGDYTFNLSEVIVGKK